MTASFRTWRSSCRAHAVRRKRLRTPALPAPASAASTVSTVLAFNNSERTKSVARLVAPAKEREVCDTNRQILDDKGNDDPNSEDGDGISDTEI